jgi:hypothetical protein
MEWCCPGFEAFYGNAGHQGAGILVRRDSSGGSEFTLQYRAVEEGEEASIGSDKPVASVVDVGMQFCPWCGRRLDKWYAKSVVALERPALKITYP